MLYAMVSARTGITIALVFIVLLVGTIAITSYERRSTHKGE